MTEWPIEDNGREFKPLPESWLDHPKARDAGADGPRCLAVSVYLNGGRIIRVRYAHPISGNVIETFGTATANPHGDGYVPLGLVDGSGWSRSFVPSPGEPHDTIRSCERDHLQTLWADRIDALDWEYERDSLEVDPEQRLIADGGKDIRETHLDEDGLWIPPELREFDVGISIRTPRTTIQRFGSPPFDPYFGMVDESHFGEADEFRDPKNPHLAPDHVEINARGEEPVTLAVDLEPELRTDGGQQSAGSLGLLQRGKRAVDRLHLVKSAIEWCAIRASTAHLGINERNHKDGDSQ